MSAVCAVPILLPQPDMHVETVRVRRDAKFAYMKHKMRRLARERLSRTRT